MLEEIKRGDEIVVQKNMDDGKPFYFNPIKISKKGDYRVNKIWKRRNGLEED